MKQKPEPKPGTPLDIVFESELNQPGAHYLKATVYDCDDSILISSQTSPALGRQFLNRKVVVTFLTRKGSRTVRLGFAGLLYELVHDYAMSSHKEAEALLIKILHRPEPMDFRMYFRITPPSGGDLSLFQDEKKVGLMDISLGGVKFIYPLNHTFLPGQAVKFKLLIGDEVFDIDGIVRQVRRPDTAASGARMQHVSVEFRHYDKKMEASLGRAIMAIERSLLTKGTM